MLKYTYAICTKKDNIPVALCYNRREARNLKRMYEAEYAGKYIINQMAVNKRVR